MREIFHKNQDTLDSKLAPRAPLSFEVTSSPDKSSIPNLIACLFAAAVLTVISAVFARLMGIWFLALGSLLVAILASQFFRDFAQFALLALLGISSLMGLAFADAFPMVTATFACIAGLAAGAITYVKGKPLSQVVLISSSGFVALLFVTLFRSWTENPTFSFLALFLLSTLLLCWLSRRVTFYFLATARASIGAHHFKDTPLVEMLSSPISSTQARGFSILLGLIAAGFLALRGMSLRSAVEALGTADAMVLFSLFCLAAATVHILTATETRKSSPIDVVRTAFTALGHWSFHRPHESAHGIYRAAWPFDAMATRLAATLLSCSLVVGSLAVTASFFPVTLRNSTPWLTLDNPTEETPLYGELVGPESDDEVLSTLRAKNDNWIRLSFIGYRQGKAFFAVSLFLGLALSIALPLIVFLSLFVLLTAPTLQRIQDAWYLAADNADETRWDTRIKLIQSSENEEERESVLVGYHAEQDYPIVVPRKTLEEHCHILGDSGSGKTALGLMPMMTQLIRFAGRDRKTASPFASSVVVMDLKGDQALFQTAKLEAEAAGLPFRWFNIEYGRSTFAFNPFLQAHVPKLSTSQWTEVLTEALSLAHGEGYGRSFFGGINQEVLGAILKAHPTRIQSFRELYEFTTDKNADLLGKKLGISKKKQEDAGELFSAIRKLAEIDALNVVPSDDVSPSVIEQRIDMRDVLHTPQVVYFFLPAGLSGTSVRQVGKLALQSLLSAAVTRRRELEEEGIHVTAEEMQRVYLLIDEFQQVASENLEIFFRQARSMKIATILANQTISDLKTQSMDLTPTVMANTRFKQYFSSTDLVQQQALIDASGELIDYAESTQRDSGGNVTGESWTEQKAPRLSRNHIIEASDQPDVSVVHLPRGAGYAQFQGYPFLMRSEFHITKDEYLAREAAAWPAENSTQGTLSFEPDANQPAASDPPKPVVKPKRSRKKKTPLDGIFEQVRKEQEARKGRRKRR